MATFVLVSGAWHAGWCWERIVPLIEAQGHTAIAPDLHGMGPDKTPVESVTLSMWADQIADVISAQAEPVILVGHSRGGIVISEAAERVPTRIKSLVYLTAFLIPSGQSLYTAASKHPVSNLSDNVSRGAEGGSEFRDSAVGPVFYNTTEPEWVDRAKSLLTAEPGAPSGTPLNLSAERFGSVPRVYIECTQDQAMPLTLQRALQADLPCNQVITLETDHSPFYSSPAELAEVLLSLA